MENFSQNGSTTINIPEDTGIDFKKLLYSFLEYWPWFIGSVLVCLLIAFLYLRYTIPVYNINSKILIKSDNSPGSSDQQGVLGQIDLLSPQNNVDNEKEVLQTHYMVGKSGG